MDEEKEDLCPFCELFGQEPEEINGDFWGQPASIQGIASCGWCARAAALSDDNGASLVEELRERREAKCQSTGQLKLF